MADIFPSGAGISEMRGVILIVRSGGGRVSMSQLAGQSGMNIDHLLPVVDAARMLGFVRIRDGSIWLTESGERMDLGNFQELIRKGMGRVEPFKSVLALLSHGAVSTPRLAESLKRKGVKMSSNRKLDEELLRRMLAKWGIRTRLLNYNGRKDTWSIVGR